MNLKEYIELNGEREIVDIEALEKCLKPKTIYDIKEGDPYFVLYINGNIERIFWSGDCVDTTYRSMGFAFLTEEEAEIRKKMLMIEEELIRLGGRRGFKGGKDNYCLKFYLKTESIDYCVTCGFMSNEIYFDTEEQLKKAVETIGEQRLIDEYLKPRIVEEDQE